ncbi:hypothetical protein M885DRAFT_619188 [Pelagophyceae sp. CCMP2097]|nr:hypothetical protein M885DRAFT_619188 [Pelagophyceae sp. CCMP2097]
MSDGAAPSRVDEAGVSVRALWPPRFEPGDGGLLRYLDEYGFAVVADVFGADDSPERVSGLQWDFLEGLPGTRVRRDAPETWEDPADWLPSPDNGIVAGYGFGHHEAQWAVRLLPRVRQAFASIWGTNDVLVSFDGGNVVRPWRRRRGWRTRGGWWHCDQNAQMEGQQGRCCAQGLVTLLDATPETGAATFARARLISMLGGLCVIPGSHKSFLEVCERSGAIWDTAGRAFVPVGPTDPVFEQGGVLVCAKAGDLILWDSRTAHCNSPALTTDDRADDASCAALIRQAAYVCMTPAALATPEVVERRRRFFEENIGTSHWPHAALATGPAWGPAGASVCSLPPLQRSLIGDPSDSNNRPADNPAEPSDGHLTEPAAALT